MTLRIQRDAITGDHTRHTARLVPGAVHAWEVSWLPGRHLSRSEAITAMILADVTSREHVQQGHWVWSHIQGWAAELGVAAPDELTRTIARPWPTVDAEPTEHSASWDDPEAGG
jgi:hypothetical protein